jgi:hypothetical protein
MGASCCAQKASNTDEVVFANQEYSLNDSVLKLGLSLKGKAN